MLNSASAPETSTYPLSLTGVGKLTIRSSEPVEGHPHPWIPAFAGMTICEIPTPVSPLSLRERAGVRVKRPWFQATWASPAPLWIPAFAGTTKLCNSPPTHDIHS